jgi:hypothetical protein
VSRVAEQGATIHRSPEKCTEPLGRVIAQNGSCETPYEAVHVEALPTHDDQLLCLSCSAHSRKQIRFEVLPHRSVRPRDQIDRPQAEILTSFLAYDLDPIVSYASYVAENRKPVRTSLSEVTQTGSWTVSVSAKKSNLGS